jgi:hypothetical protein
MNIVKLTPTNVAQYIGRDILFKTRKTRIIKRIMGLSNSGKTIQIDHPDLQNKLQIVSRNVYAIV